MITSTQNKRVTKSARLKKRAIRDKDKAFLVEGAQAVLEALGQPGIVRQLFYTAGSEDRQSDVVRAAEKAAIAVHPVSPEVMAHLTSTVTPQGLVAVARFVDEPLWRAAESLVCVPLLVEVRDPGNAGTILRSADASGAGAVVFTRSSVDVYNPKTVRATAGSLFHLPVIREVEADDAVSALRENGFRVLAAAADGRDSVYDADLIGQVAIMFGNEARGLPPEIRSLADGTIRVPIEGAAESLNLAAAATVVLFEASRQRWRASGGEAGSNSRSGP